MIKIWFLFLFIWGGGDELEWDVWRITACLDLIILEEIIVFSYFVRFNYKLLWVQYKLIQADTKLLINRYLVAIAILSTLYTAGQVFLKVQELSTGKQLLKPRMGAMIDFIGDQVWYFCSSWITFTWISVFLCFWTQIWFSD